jgi:endonuclease YncB( thermonuclease family)
VISVHDGDTLTALCDGKKIKVRLTEIDAPERTQPYSRISTNSLKSLCVDQPASVVSVGLDRYGRTLGRVSCAGVDANAEQVRRGYAWAFDKYLTDPSIKQLETEARAAQRGLWRSANPMPPWEFRHPQEKPQ